jgi:hypothetical protein
MKGLLVLAGIVAVAIATFALLPKDLQLALATHFGGYDVRSGRQQQTVVLDSWWSGDYAKGGCEQADKWMKENRKLINQFGCEAVTACTDVMPRYTACTIALGGPTATARRFEDELLTQFAINANCKGVVFARYYGPNEKISAAAHTAMDEPHWTLILDYIVGGDAQPWSLQPPKGGLLHQAEGATPAKIAADVCAVVMGHGGTVSQ